MRYQRPDFATGLYGSTVRGDARPSALHRYWISIRRRRRSAHASSATSTSSLRSANHALLSTTTRSANRVKFRGVGRPGLTGSDLARGRLMHRSQSEALEILAVQTSDGQCLQLPRFQVRGIKPCTGEQHDPAVAPRSA